MSPRPKRTRGSAYTEARRDARLQERDKLCALVEHIPFTKEERMVAEKIVTEIRRLAR